MQLYKDNWRLKMAASYWWDGNAVARRYIGHAERLTVRAREDGI